jgi:hypothetical protein
VLAEPSVFESVVYAGTWLPYPMKPFELVLSVRWVDLVQVRAIDSDCAPLSRTVLGIHNCVSGHLGSAAGVLGVLSGSSERPDVQSAIYNVALLNPKARCRYKRHVVVAGGGHRAHHAVGRCGAAGQHPRSQAAAGQVAPPTAGPHATGLLRIHAPHATRPRCRTCCNMPAVYTRNKQ